MTRILSKTYIEHDDLGLELSDVPDGLTGVGRLAYNTDFFVTA